jgi:hypothetical protein
MTPDKKKERMFVRIVIAIATILVLKATFGYVFDMKRDIRCLGDRIHVLEQKLNVTRTHYPYP